MKTRSPSDNLVRPLSPAAERCAEQIVIDSMNSAIPVHSLQAYIIILLFYFISNRRF